MPSGARAQEVKGAVTLYGWLPWINLDVKSRSGPAEIDTSVSGGDVLRALKFAFMATGEVSYGKVGIISDAVYANLGQTGTLSGPLMSTAKVDVKMLLSTTALTYNVYSENGYLAQPYAGARYVSMKTDVAIVGGGPIGIEKNASVDLSWWDPVIGFRGRVPLTDQLSATGLVDIGGFGAGSQFTWEFFTGLDYAFTDYISADAGFRYISIDYNASKANMNLQTYGPLIGLTVRF